MHAGDTFTLAGASGFYEAGAGRLMLGLRRAASSGEPWFLLQGDRSEPEGGFPTGDSSDVLLFHVSCIILETDQTEVAFPPKKPGLTCA